MRGARSYGIAGLAMLALVFAGGAEASVVKKTIPDLAAESDIVVHGKVGASWSYFENGMIFTEYTVHIETNVIGNPGGETVPVVVRGGIVGDIGVEVSDQPRLARGQETVLFLDTHGQGGAFAVAGLSQGQVDVRGGRVPAFDMTLDEFLGRVQGGGIGLEEHAGHRDGHNPGGGGGGGPGGGGKGGDECFKVCQQTWKQNGDVFGGKWHPGLEDNGSYHWSINNNSNSPFGDAELKAELQSAADVWNDTAGACWGLGTVDPTITQDDGLTDASFDGRNAVTFGDVGSAVAVVSNWFFRNNRNATVETDMTFNTVDYSYGIGVCGSNSQFDLHNIATHEWGHWICLEDQYEASNSANTMYGYVSEGECDKSTLEQCDKDGAQDAYGACN